MLSTCKQILLKYLTFTAMTDDMSQAKKNKNFDILRITAIPHLARLASKRVRDHAISIMSGPNSQTPHPVRGDVFVILSRIR